MKRPVERKKGGEGKDGGGKEENNKKERGVGEGRERDKEKAANAFLSER